MNLYLDDDSASGLLVTLLKKAAHQVTVPADVNLSGVADPRHLAHAVEHTLVLLTRNHDDFEDLHNLIQFAGGEHPGILVVRLDNDSTRDLKERDIVRAILNLERAGVPIANDLHILNHWR